jgi:2-dehydro-3-deoxyglucarate aldolase/4-hydroxy-2-oxoheptanedioate aldolase
MKENKVKRKLAAGEAAVGTMMMEFASTGIARLAAVAGAEFAVYDMEHTGWSMETVRSLMATSSSADLVPIVRPPRGDGHFISRVLDVGAMGIVVPMLASPEHARAVVEAAKYPPAGKRGAAFAVAHDGYVWGDVGEKMRRANEEVLVIGLLETVEGLEKVEEIAAVPGLDVLWIGQFDLTSSMGIPGQFQHPEFLRASRRILEACQRAGKAAGFGSLDVGAVAAARGDGFRFLVYTADLWIYQNALRDGLERIRSGPRGAPAGGR